MEVYLVSYRQTKEEEVTVAIQGNNILDLSFRNIIKLERLPNKVNKINLNGNNIKKLSNLSKDLTEISAVSNRIFKIEDNLPKLNKLNLSHNNITVIENLPNSLQELNLSYNYNIEKLENLPKKLKQIILSNGKLESVSKLPTNLQKIDLNNNKIRTIDVPQKVEILNLSNNDLNTFPKLFTSLIELNLSNNRLIKIINLKNFVNLESLNLANNNLKKIENLAPNLKYLNLSNNKIANIENLTKKLEKLVIKGNNIFCADYDYPKTLVELDLENNRISLIKPINKNIETLNMSHNYIKNIKFTGNIKTFTSANTNLLDIPELPNSLVYLNLNESKVKKLIDFTTFTNLVTLNLDYLDITEMFDVPDSLKKLSLKGNKIKELKNVSRNLENLDISYNLISEYPLFILEYINLRVFIHIGNPIETRNFVFDRWLYQFNNVGNFTNNMVYQNGQNVHSSAIQASFRNSLTNLLKDSKKITFNTAIVQMKNSEYISDNSKALIESYCENSPMHSVYYINYRELFTLVWSRITSHQNSKELIKVLDEEIYSGMGLCYTGRITRLVNVLTGFYPDIEIQISESEQISNIIVSLQKKYSDLDLKKAVKKELEERKFPASIIGQWLAYL